MDEQKSPLQQPPLQDQAPAPAAPTQPVQPAPEPMTNNSAPAPVATPPVTPSPPNTPQQAPVQNSTPQTVQAPPEPSPQPIVTPLIDTLPASNASQEAPNTRNLTLTEQAALLEMTGSISFKRRVRGFASFIFLSWSILFFVTATVAYWVENTLTNTESYVEIVGPLAEQPQIQEFASRKLSGSIVDQFDTRDLAQKLLSKEDQKLAPALLKVKVSNAVNGEVEKVIKSRDFAQLWTDTNAKLHTQFMDILSGTSDKIELNARPELERFLDMLNKTDLDFVTELPLDQRAGTIMIPENQVEQTRKGYKSLLAVDTISIVAGVAFLALALLTSTQRIRTVRSFSLRLALFNLTILIGCYFAVRFQISGVAKEDLAAIQKILNQLLQPFMQFNMFVLFGCVAIFVGTTAYLYIEARNKKAKEETA